MESDCNYPEQIISSLDSDLANWRMKGKVNGISRSPEGPIVRPQEMLMWPKCFSLASVGWEESGIRCWEEEGDTEKVDTGPV